ncbi:MAG: DNA ligase-associated DEXH box helicase [Candidatus Roseilinea sp.]|nr:MAG: DNA ligase-associated DEXH box helicase [Candidatus Roseilinea sp.]
MEAALACVEAWFAARGWQPFDYQRQAWRACLQGRSGLIHASTGAGKTYAAWLGPLAEALAEQREASDEAGATDASSRHRSARRAARAVAPPLRVLWVTPLRALAADTEQSLREPVESLGLGWTIERRTGDTTTALRAKQKERLPTVLVTTPESLSLMLSWPDARERFAGLRYVIVDEWHELLGTKRGTQTELALARLRCWQPGLRTWGLSATLGNLDVALRALVGAQSTDATLICADLPKEVIIESLLPEQVERFPWAGHLGLVMLPRVLEAIEANASTLIFTNTRSQTEMWYQAILEARPEWAGQVALHHGSLDKAEREFVERGLKEGRLRAVVCTSSLDLGVDFSPVDCVLQVGSPKGTARLLQRAGRSGHAPGRPSRVICVPTHALELIEFAAVRDAIRQGRIEARLPLSKPLDVLAQHVVTVAAGGGFRSEALLAEVRTAYSYRDLSDVEWQWVLDFVTRGGRALSAYPEFRRVVCDDGVYRVADPAIAQRHRLSIGTIVSEASIHVQYLRGGRLGTVEESFVSWLKPGECFRFAGRLLEFVRLQDNTAWVRRAEGRRATVPRWMGSRMPLSTELSHVLREKLDQARRSCYADAEMALVRPLLELQAQRSKLPEPAELLIERVQTREGHHLFFFPFDGRAVNEGLAALVAYRLSRIRPISFSFAVNDYGFELLSPDRVDWVCGDVEERRTTEPAHGECAPSPLRSLFSPDNLAEDLLASLNAAELARRQFREVARIAGLIFEGLPGRRKSSRQLQASGALFYEVFSKYDPDNLLLMQARREVLERQLEESRLARALQRISRGRITLLDVAKPTPLAFPLMVDRLREQLSSETLLDRIRKMQAQLEA